MPIASNCMHAALSCGLKRTQTRKAALARFVGAACIRLITQWIHIVSLLHCFFAFSLLGELVGEITKN